MAARVEPSWHVPGKTAGSRQASPPFPLGTLAKVYCGKARLSAFSFSATPPCRLFEGRARHLYEIRYLTEVGKVRSRLVSRYLLPMQYSVCIRTLRQDTHMQLRVLQFRPSRLRAARATTISISVIVTLYQ